MNKPVVSPVTLMLRLWAASMTAGTRSSVGPPWSSATPGGYQDSTSTPGEGLKVSNETAHGQGGRNFNRVGIS